MNTMTGNYPIEAAANSVLREAEKRGIALTHMKLQKLLYLAYGYYAGLTGEPLADEDFEAWQFGPVSPTVYQSFKDCGGHTIDPGRRMERFVLDDEGARFELPYLPEDDGKAARVVDYVFDTYGAKSAIYLSDLTHKEGSPWDQADSIRPRRRNIKIDNDAIREYFAKLVKH